MNTIHDRILGAHVQQFHQVQATGFRTADLIELVSSWPRIPSEYKMHVIADAVFSHYMHHPEFSKELSATLHVLTEFKKDTAAYRLGRLINAWLHQRWTFLPCAQLPVQEAHHLFPQHALAPPVLPPPKEPFAVRLQGWARYPSKVLHRPLEWEGALDGFRGLLDHITQPANLSVIGFGDGKELVLLSQKWPNTVIHGFEQPSLREENKIHFSSNIAVHYDDSPLSYKHNEQPVELALIRHPNCVGNSWSSIVFKALNSLAAPNGMLLITFYSERELSALKAQFLSMAESNKYTWTDRVNPRAYNPFFMSMDGKYSFDFFVAAIKLKSAQPNILGEWAAVKKRTNEQSPTDIKNRLKKFVVVEHPEHTIMTSPGFYEEDFKSPEYDEPQICFKCRQVFHNFFRAFNVISGEHPITANVQFCAEHVPGSKAQWEEMLKEPWSGWKNKNPKVRTFFLVGQSMPKTEASRL